MAKRLLIKFELHHKTTNAQGAYTQSRGLDESSGIISKVSYKIIKHRVRQFWSSRFNICQQV